MLLRIPPPFRLVRPHKQSPMTLVSAGVGIARIFMGMERAWPARTVKDREGQGCARPVQLARDPALLLSKCQPGKPRSNMAPSLRVWGPRTHTSHSLKLIRVKSAAEGCSQAEGRRASQRDKTYYGIGAKHRGAVFACLWCFSLFFHSCGEVAPDPSLHPTPADLSVVVTTPRPQSLS